MDLANFSGADASGTAGTPVDVDTHFWKTLGRSALLTLTERPAGVGTTQHLETESITQEMRWQIWRAGNESALAADVGPRRVSGANGDGKERGKCFYSRFLRTWFSLAITTSGMVEECMRVVSSSLAVVAAFLVVGGPHYRVTLTDSVPRGIYKVTEGPVSRGMLVAECLPLDLAAFAKERGYLQRGGCPGNVMPILKEVVGVPGDEINLTDTYVAVNGHLILNSETRKVDSRGRAMPQYPRGKFVVKAGEVFLVATNSSGVGTADTSGQPRLRTSFRHYNLCGPSKRWHAEGE